MRDMESELYGFSYYQQPDGCIEASYHDNQGSDVLHFHTRADALTFIKEFTAFVEQLA